MRGRRASKEEEVATWRFSRKTGPYKSEQAHLYFIYFVWPPRAVPATSDAESMNEQEVVGIVEVE